MSTKKMHCLAEIIAVFCVILSASLFAGCSSGNLKFPGDSSKDTPAIGMEPTRVTGLSGDTGLANTNTDENVTAKAALCYNVTRDSVVFSKNANDTFTTDCFSPLTIIEAYGEYKDSPDRERAYDSSDISEMIQEKYVQDVTAVSVYKTAKNCIEEQDFLDIYSYITYVPQSSRLTVAAQYDCYDETMYCSRVLYLKKDGSQYYLLVLIGVASEADLNTQTDAILQYLVQ